MELLIAYNEKGVASAAGNNMSQIERKLKFKEFDMPSGKFKPDYLPGEYIVQHVDLRSEKSADGDTIFRTYPIAIIGKVIVK